MLSKKRIKDLIENQGMITNFLDLDIQLQVNGFDLTVESIQMLDRGTSIIGFENKSMSPYVYLSGPLDDEITLEKGFYLLTMCETIKLPLNVAAAPLNRTSLFRMGSLIAGGWYDRGYQGQPQTGLFVTHPIILKPRA